MIVIGLVAVLGSLLFGGLGVWQLERLGQKNQLVAAIAARVDGAPADPSRDGTWERFDPQQDEYRRVSVSGQFDRDRETLVQAVTGYGGGFWVMTPLRLVDGRAVLVNRGFVPFAQSDGAVRAMGFPSGPVTVSGLLRRSEPGGGFLRANDAATDRWYSRDVAAIAAHEGVAEAAPFFIDADRAAAGTYPIGGLTVLSFPNNHLVYALTWFTLALMLGGGFGYLVWERRQAR